MKQHCNKQWAIIYKNCGVLVLAVSNWWQCNLSWYTGYWDVLPSRLTTKILRISVHWHKKPQIHPNQFRVGQLVKNEVLSHFNISYWHWKWSNTWTQQCFASWAFERVKRKKGGRSGWEAEKILKEKRNSRIWTCGESGFGWGVTMVTTCEFCSG